MTPLTAARTLEMFFLDTRGKILEVAAALDRLDRGDGTVANDPRMERIRRALATLQQDGPGRAEAIQLIFSLPYDPTWDRPQPK